MLANLTGGFTPDAVNVIMAHLTCTGGVFGGGERAAQSIMEYHVPAAIFPPETHYVALGHLHRASTSRPRARSTIPAPRSRRLRRTGQHPRRRPRRRSRTRPAGHRHRHPDHRRRRLRTVEGTVEQLTGRAEEFGDDYLRLVLTQAAYAGMRDDLLEALPNALEIRIHPDFATTSAKAGLTAAGPTRTPAELFADYCGSVGVDDDRIRALFNQLHDDLTNPAARA